MATARDIIKRALRLIQVTASGETIRDEEAQDALEALNGMLAIWSASSIMVPYQVTEVLSVSTASMALTTRPIRVVGAWVYDGASDLEMRLISQSDYLSILDKAVTGIPASLYCDEFFPVSTIYVYPTPDRAYPITLRRWDHLANLPTLETEIVLPEEYKEAIAFNLAGRLAPEYGTSLSQEVATLALMGLDALKNLNAHPVDSMTCGIRSAQGRRMASVPGNYMAFFRSGF
jgi:hypothetical protein